MSTNEAKPVKIKSTNDEYVVRFLKHIRKLDLAKNTKYAYDQTITRCIELLDEGNMTTDPTKIGEKEIIYLRDVAMGELTTKTKTYYFSFFNSYLEYYGNKTYKNMHIHWPSDERVRVDWLEPAEAKALLTAPLTLGQQLAISLELCMGLRRVEVIRLTTDKIYSDRIDVRGKGRAGGKWRSVPLASHTREALSKYLAYREKMIEQARRDNPDAVIPKEVFLHYKNKVLSPYSEHGVGFDYMFVLPVRKITGIHYGNHTLRRTFGRQLWKNGTPIETISKLLGHESIAVTLKYIGVNIGDMTKAITDLSFD